MLTAFARRALAHADQDDAVAGRHHVAPLDRRGPPVVVEAAVPGVELDVGEARMEPVDGLQVQCLVLPGGPEHRVDRDTAVEPGARVPHEQLIRQGREHEVGRLHRAADRPADVVRQLLFRQPAREDRGQVRSGQPARPFGQRLREDRRHLLGPEAALQDPLARFLVLHRLRQQLVEEQHLDVFLAHQVDEGVVLLPCAPHPDHVVEQERLAVRRREALVCDVRPVHHDRAQLADLRVDAERGLGGSAHAVSFPLGHTSAGFASPRNWLM